MVLFALFISGSFTVGSLMVPYLEPAPLNAMRFAAAALLMAGLAFGVRRHAFGVPAQPLRFVLYGVLNAIYFVTMFVALTLTEPVATSAVFTLTPLLAALFAFVLLGQRSRPIVLVSLLIAGVGALWVIFRGDPGALAAFDIGAGEAIFFGGCVCYALVSPLMRRLAQDEPGMVFTFWSLLATALAIGLYATPGLLALDWGQLPPVIWWGLLYLVIFPTAASTFLLQFASLRLPSSKVMAYGYLVPSFVILIEGLVGNGWASPAIMAGALATLVGLGLLVWVAD